MKYILLTACGVVFFQSIGLSQSDSVNFRNDSTNFSRGDSISSSERDSISSFKSDDEHISSSGNDSVKVSKSEEPVGQSHEMTVLGTIRDARTNKIMTASIRYSSIPTGSIHGEFNDSTFSFKIFGTAKYQITAVAFGYSIKTVIVDPKKDRISETKQIERDIKLTPTGEAIRLDHLIFPQGKSKISSESFDELDEIAQMLKENKTMVIQLEGHTDSQGNAKENMKLSRRRVEAVKKYLVEKGVSKNHVKTKAFGGTQPLRNEMTPEDRALNRRVEMRILQN